MSDAIDPVTMLSLLRSLETHEAFLAVQREYVKRIDDVQTRINSLTTSPFKTQNLKQAREEMINASPAELVREIKSRLSSQLKKETQHGQS